MKVKLVYPFAMMDIVSTASYPSYSIAVLCSRLKNNGYDVDVFDYEASLLSKKNEIDPAGVRLRDYIKSRRFIKIKKIHDYLFSIKPNNNIKKTIEEVASRTDYDKYQLIGISVLSQYHIYPALLLSKYIKEKYPDKKVVCGGLSVDEFGKEFFISSGCVDYVVIGAGEEALLGLVKFLEGKMEIDDVKGLLYRNSEGVLQENPVSEYSLEEESLPDYSGFDLRDYVYFQETPGKRSVLYRLSDGCTNQCYFCERSKKISYKTVKKAVGELKLLCGRYDTNIIDFTDSLINFSTKYLKEFRDELKEQGLKISWRSYAVLSSLTEEQLEIFKESGCEFIKYGMESADPYLIKIMGKYHDPESSALLMKKTYELGIKSIVFFIVGFPYETERSRSLTLEFIKSNSKYMYRADLNKFYLPKGVPAVLHPDKYGLYDIKPYFNKKWLFYEYAFSEKTGLKWPEKLKEQRKNLQKMRCKVYYMVFAGRYKVKIPYWLSYHVYYKLFRRSNNFKLLRSAVSYLKKAEQL